MVKVTLYTSRITSTLKVETECRRMRDLFAAKAKKITFELTELDISESTENKEQFQKTGKKIVPVAVIGDNAYNFEELQDLNEMEELDGLLSA